ncbi:NAD(P)-binding domain-containing protein [Alteribacillus sp. HJP-4]|uniref:NAD(P)-binding domain-containing protein n=1 Tax=Alteribacillus sp. HJP-4 TaxID=2775394 RepID=UPI0035CCF250
MNNSSLPVAIIGGGPAGLAAAAHLSKRGHSFLLFESGEKLGNHFLDYAHVRLFSTWEYNIDEAAKYLLEKNGVELPNPDELPLGGEIATKYLQPLGNLPELKPFIYLNSKVVHTARKGFDKVKSKGREDAPFELHVESSNQEVQRYYARAVIDATGTWQQPNPLVSGGLIEKSSSNIHYRIPDILHEDRKTFENKRVLIIGSGHSAFHSILELAKLKTKAPNTEITWMIRRSNIEEIMGGGDNDQLPERGALGTRLKQVISDGAVNVYTSAVVQSLRKSNGNRVIVHADVQGEPMTSGPYDEVIANTGSRPAFQFLSEIRYTADPALESVPALAPLIDPNVHSCGTVRPHGEKELRQPEKDFYIIGAKSYGRAPTFLMATGYEQARSVTAYLCGDEKAAERVELHLPETGVCSTNPPVLEIQLVNNNSCCS